MSETETLNIASALKICSHALSSYDFVPILTHFCFGEGFVYAYDDRIAVAVFEDFGIVGAVRGKPFLDILEAFQEKTLEVSQLENNSLVLRGDNGFSASLPMLPSELEDLSSLLPEDWGEARRVGPDFFSSLELVSGLSNFASLSAELSGVTFEFGELEVKMHASEHSSTLSEVKVGLPKSKSAVGKLVLLRDVCGTLVKVYKTCGVEECDVFLSKDWLLLSIEPGVVVFCKALSVNGVFADYGVRIGRIRKGLTFLPIPKDFFSAIGVGANLQGTSDRASVRFSKTRAKGALLVEVTGAYGSMSFPLKVKGDFLENTDFLVDPNQLLKVKDKVQSFAVGEKAFCFVSEDDKFFHAIAYMQ